MPAEVHIIFNPISGGEARRMLLQECSAALARKGFAPVLCRTTHRGHARQLAAEAPDSAAAVVAAGGDGTVRDVAAGLAGRPVPLAVLPVGNENLFAKWFGFECDPEHLARTLAAGRTRPLDLGVARTDGAEPEVFTVVAGVGFDAQVLRRLERIRTGHVSRLTYVMPMVRTVGEYRWPPMRVTVDGKPLMEQAGIVIVANTPNYALDLRICPDASPDDGLLDVAALQCRHLGNLARLAFWTALRRHVGRPGISHARGRVISVEGPGDVPWELDGEAMHTLPATFEVRPAAVRLLDTRD